MRWFGHEDKLPEIIPEEKPLSAKDQDPDALVDIIRYNGDAQQRAAALMALEKLGMVERFDGEKITKAISTPRSKIKVETPP